MTLVISQKWLIVWKIVYIHCLDFLGTGSYVISRKIRSPAGYVSESREPNHANCHSVFKYDERDSLDNGGRTVLKKT